MFSQSLIAGLFVSTLLVPAPHAQQMPAPPTETIKTAASRTPEEQQLLDLSKSKWDWMAGKNVDKLNVLFDDKAMFTHMGGTWGKSQELATIKGGGIWYKKAFVYETDVRTFGDAAIVLSDMDLAAVVGGREVTNPFMVTEVYSKENGQWKLAQLTFSHLVRPVKVSNTRNY